MTEKEIFELCQKVSKWDQSYLDRIIGNEAILFAKNHEFDVRSLCHEMWNVFPLGISWWRIRKALINKKKKDDAIIERANQIQQDRASGKIIVSNGNLIYAPYFL